MTEDHGRQLFDRILAGGDDGDRRVYADWLAEAGDRDRATFIQVQLEAMQLPVWDPRRLSLRLRSQAILAAHEAAWRADLPDLEAAAPRPAGARRWSQTWGDYRGGFVEAVAFDDARDLPRVAACRAAAPIRRVAIRWPEGQGWQGLDALAGIQWLTLFGTVLDDTDLHVLAASPALRALRELDILDGEMRAPALRRLISSPRLRNLRALRLPHHRLGGEAVGILLDTDPPPALTTLDLSMIPEADDDTSFSRSVATLNEFDVIQLASWAPLARVRSLDLSGTRIGGEGLQGLLASPHGSGLDRLALRGLDEAPLRLEAFSTPHPRLGLRVLDLGRNVLDRTGAGQLAESPALSGLEVLVLDRVAEAEPRALDRLFEAPWMDHVKVLQLSDTGGPAAFDALVARDPASLHTLAMVESFRGTRRADLSGLTASPLAERLISLDLSANRLSDRAAEALGRATSMGRLIHLSLRDNDISAAADAALAASPVGAGLRCRELTHAAHDHNPRRSPPQLPLPDDDDEAAYHGPLRNL